MKTTGMLMLLASLWSLPHPAGAQGLGDFQVIVAPEKTTRAILPLADEASRQYLAAMATIYNGGHSDRETPGLELQFGPPPFSAYYPPEEDPGAVYARWHPCPRMRFVELRPRGNDMLSGRGTGVAAVEAWTDRWPEGPSARQGIGGWRETLWRWEVPIHWQTGWPYFSDRRYPYRVRYAVLDIVIPRWVDGKETASRYDPVIFCFDALSGLRWRAEVPVRMAVQAYSAQAGLMPDLTSDGAGGAAVSVGVNADGSRAWVAAFWARPRISILFVYGADGAVRRTIVLPGRLAVGWHTRCPTREASLLDFQWSAPKEVQEALRYAEPIDEGYLISSDGELLGRLVDEGGLPVSGVRVSDTHALGSQLRKDGVNRKLLYRLPERRRDAGAAITAGHRPLQAGRCPALRRPPGALRAP